MPTENPTQNPTSAVIAAWTALVRAGHRVLAAVEADLKTAGFPPLAWYDVLLELRRKASEGLRPNELEKRVLLAQYNVSRLADRLEKAGYLVKHPCPEDKRGNLLKITGEGRALLTRMWPVYANAIQHRVGQKLTEPEAAELAGLLRRLSDTSDTDHSA